METVYLKSGVKCRLEEKRLDGKFLVNPYEYYQGYEGEEYEDLSGNLKIVDEVFKCPPTLVIEKSYQEWIDKIKSSAEIHQKLIKSNNELRLEKSNLESNVTDLKKIKFDFSDFRKAKTISYFVPGRIQPYTVGDLNRYQSDERFNLVLTICTSNSNTKYSHYRFYTDNNYSESTQVDSNYGFFFDKSDEEMQKIAIERCSKMDVSKFSLYDFNYNNKTKPIEKYFSKNAFDRLEELEKQQKENSLSRTKNEIEKYLAEYKKITGEDYR